MPTKTVRISANSTFQKLTDGPADVILNPVKGHAELYCGNSAPAPTVGNTFLMKAVAGENYLQFSVANGSSLYVRGLGTANVTFSAIIGN